MPFFVNIMVLNKDAIVEKAVMDQGASKEVGRLANAIVSDDLVSMQIARQLQEQA